MCMLATCRIARPNYINLLARYAASKVALSVYSSVIGAFARYI